MQYLACVKAGVYSILEEACPNLYKQFIALCIFDFPGSNPKLHMVDGA